MFGSSGRTRTYKPFTRMRRDGHCRSDAADHVLRHCDWATLRAERLRRMGQFCFAGPSSRGALTDLNNEQMCIRVGIIGPRTD